MITEKGCVKTSAIDEAGALVLYRKKLKLILLIMLAVGTAGVVAYVAVSTVWQNKYDTEPFWIKALLIFAVPFTLGLIGTITVFRLQKYEAKACVNSTCAFFDDCFLYKISNSDVNDKIKYSDAVLRREHEKYGYIYVFSKSKLIVFDKEDLTVQELNAIRRRFRKKLADGVEEAELKAYSDGDKNELS